MSNDEKSKGYELAKMSSLKGNYPVYKPNPLLLARDNMKVMQARFFTAYLCKVKPSEPDTYKARFSFSAFCKMLDVDTKNIGRIKAAADSVLECKYDFAEYVRKHGNAELDPMLTKKVNLFEVFEITGDSEAGYFVEVTPTRTMEYLLRKQEEYGYVTYKLQNTINLSTTRNIRLYEFLKRSEGVGVNVDVSTLKAYLGLSDEDYTEMKDFKRKVLDKGLKEINSDKTDIQVSYTERRKGRGGRIVGFKFSVKRKNVEDVGDIYIDDAAGAFELSQDDIDLFNKKKELPDAEPNQTDKKPDTLRFYAKDGQSIDLSAEKLVKATEKVSELLASGIKLTEEQIRELMVEAYLEADVSPASEPELPGQMDIEDYIDEPSEDYTRSPLELTFTSDTEKRKYVEGYLSVHFKEKENHEYCLDVVPEDVHRYEEANVEAIKSVAKQYVKLEDQPFGQDLNISAAEHKKLMCKAVRAYTSEKWVPRHSKMVKNDATSYFTSCFGYWLMDNSERFLPNTEEPPKSFDDDEFFNAAVEKTKRKRAARN